MKTIMFKLIKKDAKTKARRGEITTGRGILSSPFFMPVGTNGSVKTLTAEDLEQIGADLMLSNTYHLYLRPGMEVVQKAEGLHKFIGWDKPILTDSGGYQVFSLKKLRKIKSDGVEFQSHLDGSTHFFSPEKVIDIQGILGSDILMPLDVCAPYPCDYPEAKEALKLTWEWAKTARSYFDQKWSGRRQAALFGIIQGAFYKDLRIQAAQEIREIGFDGYAVGGISVGEPVDKMFESLAWVEPWLPADQPRYLMGIGLPDQIVRAVGEGVDMFDTVLPTRYGRHGTAFTRKGRVILRNAEHAKDNNPIDASCACTVCRKYSRSYLRHLANQNEITGLRLITYHNVYFYIDLMRQIRRAIEEDRYEDFQKEFLKEYYFVS